MIVTIDRALRLFRTLTRFLLACFGALVSVRFVCGRVSKTRSSSVSVRVPFFRHQPPPAQILKRAERRKRLGLSLTAEERCIRLS